MLYNPAISNKTKSQRIQWTWFQIDLKFTSKCYAWVDANGGITPFFAAWKQNHSSLEIYSLIIGSSIIFLFLCYLNQALESEEGFSLTRYFPFSRPTQSLKMKF
jgi:hypothetical protein